MLIYATSISARLKYTGSFIFQEILNTAVAFTSQIDEYKNYKNAKINYSPTPICENEIWFAPNTLLFETDIHPQPIQIIEAYGTKVFFATSGHCKFDVFAATFYLLSRYEEYLPHTKDVYGRYAVQNSLAYKHNFLQEPLINIWVEKLVSILQSKFPAQAFSLFPFSFIPTYDIDIAWSYLHKNLVKNIGGLTKSVVTGKLQEAYSRLKVLSTGKNDPYDAYDFLNNLHQQNALKPIYFFLVANKNGKYDKNILPKNIAFQKLVLQHAKKYKIGLHPSWQSGNNPTALLTELENLQTLAQQKITASRQHYIRFQLPHTYQNLIQQGITEDYSMGYGSINGFRASVASPFYWFNLNTNQATSLKVFPFCYMDANSYYEQKYSPLKAQEELMYYYTITKQVSGTFISIWHNQFLGSEKRFINWKALYTKFIQAISPKN